MKQDIMKQKTLSNWLKYILVGTGICGVIVYLFVIPMCGQSIREMYPEFSNCYWPWLVFLWASGIPCFAVLVLGWKIAGNIGEDKSFSMENAKLFKQIACLAAGDTIFFFVGNLALFLSNMNHPSMLLASFAIEFVGVAVSVAAVVLAHLVSKAALLQEESDLTI